MLRSGSIADSVRRQRSPEKICCTRDWGARRSALLFNKKWKRRIACGSLTKGFRVEFDPKGHEMHLDASLCSPFHSVAERPA